MYELIRQWRAKGSKLNALGEWPTIMLTEAANQLEQAWHDDRHNGEWSPEICRVCVKEMMEFTSDE